MKGILVLFLFTAFLLTSCETDENGNCTTSDWIGTYTLDASTENCPDSGTISLSEIIVVSEGSSSGTLNFEGLEAEIDGCSVNESTFIFSATLNGNSMSLTGFGCSGTYNKN
jgi:hypothetical protein